MAAESRKTRWDWTMKKELMELKKSQLPEKTSPAAPVLFRAGTTSQTENAQEETSAKTRREFHRIPTTWGSSSQVGMEETTAWSVSPRKKEESRRSSI
ncbi:hypothetical protein B9Z55_022891 [Caenorhabditis nigoni]|uniref:Uncharacterized protein n=1 Tax=Caenorhabditis nigoni TaxID=1611254 RepID=A0A2G5SMW0_9PELO|nr:hypothetical protein B9Z55_022891 [Caenorhabditis nigoni]